MMSQQRADDAGRDVAGMAVLNELADALARLSGEGGAGPDDGRDADPGQVLGALEPVGILLRGRPPRQPEPQEHHRAGSYVGQVVDRVAQQPDRTGAAAIAQPGIPGEQQAIAYLVFALIGTLGVGIPVGIYFAMAHARRSCSPG
jgi:hypothetical protein